MRAVSAVLPAILGGLALLPSSAFAGGLGLLGTAGLHQELVYYYGSNDVQGIDAQSLPNFGGGIETYMGDQDSRILGAARFYYLSDQPQRDPDINESVPDPIWVLRDEKRDLGLVSVGIYWGLLGDPTRLQLDLSSFIGACAFTPDDTEFAMGEIGIGGHYQFAEHMQVFVNVAGTARYRKMFYMGGNAYGGVRYLFD